VASPPQRVLRRAGTAARLPRADHRRVRTRVGLAGCIEETIADVRELPFPAPLLGRVADNTIRVTDGLASFTKLTEPTPLQARALELADTISIE
jgi:hypothetical protein